jgi:uncharacterized protein (DUF885 family)
MRRSLLLLALLVPLAACQPTSHPAPVAVDAGGASQADAAFQDLARRALEGWLALSPVNATQAGEHRHDHRLDDLGPEGRGRLEAFAQATLAELEGLDLTSLSRENQVDAAILRNQLEYDLWTSQTLQPWAWDPQVYGGLAGNAIYGLMAREFAPLPERLKAATARMQQIPRLLAQARANLDPARVPRIHAETAARQNAGILGIVDGFITPSLDALEPDAREQTQAAITALRQAVAEHQRWLDNTLVPNAAGDFRIGAQLYDQKLQFSLLSSLSRAQIRQRAEDELARVRAQMYQVSRTVLGQRGSRLPLPASPSPAQEQAAIEAALELAYAQRPARDQVVADAEAALAQATGFVRHHDLMTLPDAPVEIIEMPEFQRGVAVAYCDSPGPLDKHLKTFYAVSPIPGDWTDEQVDSFLREYNSRMIHLLSIHEGTPGHYLEGWHSAKFPSTLRAVLRSGMFAEGWAVYTERMMADAGYLDNDPLFRLVQLKFYLRTIANAILDQGVHVDGWDRGQAMDLMVRQTFQQEREAAGKWVRAQLTSAQLPTYFVGAQEHFDTRQAVEQARGERFELKAYHDQVLSYGAPPVRFVRQLMLDQPIQ